ncbi:hypothetical protein Q75_04850 [Bacillus coahuilensis p1.1.43]|uniref:Uncharacterized protein n=1 Tax=Bacillus coahuilensis p1.1.43 TaxID=1150625 RepID=A0A147KA49_9BACI|nr:hypothetical protein [Bacillus coahuilensis]KUP07563.1 hypothetical protein Q75_04850 [Bacillus coahuilensis p1.1.43]
MKNKTTFLQKYPFLISSVMVIIINLTGCGSPLKSNTEVVINESFGTHFDLVDTVKVEQKVGVDNYETTTILNPSNMVEYLEGATAYDETLTGIEFDYIFTFLTSESMREYNHRQQEASIKFSQSKNILCYERTCLKLSDDFILFLKENHALN